jgi:hypothetical protein
MPTTRLIAGATVRYQKRGRDRLLIVCTPDDVEHPIAAMRMGSQMAPVPDSVKIIDPTTKKPIRPSHRFWVTLETLDPFHMVIDTEWP